MKKFATAAFAAATALAAAATQVKYADVCVDGKGEVEPAMLARLEAAGATTNDMVEISDIKAGRCINMIDIAKRRPELAPEFDALFVSPAATNLVPANCIFLRADMFPKAFAEATDKLRAKYPLRASISERLGTWMWSVWNYSGLTPQETLAMMTSETEHFSEAAAFDRLSSRLKACAQQEVKRALRRKGKSFVAKVVDGVTVNPLSEPLDEFAAALNAPRMAGFNEWVDKYGIQWPKVDLSWLPDAAAVEEVKQKVLFDELKFGGQSYLLRLCLGTDAYNAFVTEYNEGSQD